MSRLPSLCPPDARSRPIVELSERKWCGGWHTLSRTRAFAEVNGAFGVSPGRAARDRASGHRDPIVANVPRAYDGTGAVCGRRGDQKKLTLGDQKLNFSESIIHTY